MVCDKQRIFIYKWKGSTQDVARIRATSQRQAEYRLSLQRGQRWTDEALDTGLIYLSGTVEPRPAKSSEPPAPKLQQAAFDFNPVDEAINQLVKTGTRKLASQC